ncbi:MAG TPA: hypothetical protein VGS41_03475, partial [Chthonomonadales bacterium]|nr:hypothetical protein [Chthonomonadales bacterium]
MRAHSYLLNLLLALTCGSLISLAGNRSAAAIQLDAVLGFGARGGPAYYGPDTWIPLTIFVSGASGPGDAQLQVQYSDSSFTTIYTRRVTLVNGANDAAFGFVLPPASDDPY